MTKVGPSPGQVRPCAAAAQASRIQPAASSDEAEALDAALLAADERADAALLAELYEAAAQATNATDARAFFLTQAYVFALDAGSRTAPRLRAALVDMGRDA